MSKMVATDVSATLSLNNDTGNIEYAVLDVVLVWSIKQAIDFHKNFGEVIAKAKQLVELAEENRADKTQ